MYRLGVIGILLAIGSCIGPCTTRDEWLGTVYPNAGDLTRSYNVGTFETLEACRAVASRAAGPYGDYECGLNCKSDRPGLYVCEETRR